ncbi:hypothetical protein BC938DRAFT_478107 [Jimgerdemannia flammicorona]|uniref:Cytosol aminopeptidase domain-containing protein n=1 Tax=Jimgerdemannia flammicorona TaxID=994334 RepID=A0A433QNE1_9FUNG|nr:hypothetical protein BC938DRAFT_478107 [Jimgerdemannia flammicorona]
MNAFLSVAKGSQEPLRFLEIHYKGERRRGRSHWDLSGRGALSLRTFQPDIIIQSLHFLLAHSYPAAASLSIPHLTWRRHDGRRLYVRHRQARSAPSRHLPSGLATKPGDIINGRCVADTDSKGRLILADALYYLTSKFEPYSGTDLATLTGALGQVYAGWGMQASASSRTRTQLNQAATRTSDAFWRMSLHPDYLKPMRAFVVADFINIGNRSEASVLTAAAFLKEFVLGLETPVESTEEEASTPTAVVVVKEEGGTIRGRILILPELWRAILFANFDLPFLKFPTTQTIIHPFTNRSIIRPTDALAHRIRSKCRESGHRGADPDVKPHVKSEASGRIVPIL